MGRFATLLWRWAERPFVVVGRNDVKNHFEVRGQTTVIFIRRRNKPPLEALIDTDDLPLAAAYPGRWFSYYSKVSDSYYIIGQQTEGCLLLHRVVMHAPKGLQVDHRNHDGLDNRKANLRLGTASQNQQNRKGPQRNGSSGFRGVTWSKVAGKWAAQYQLNGRNHHVGLFTTKEKAAAAAAAARTIAMPFSKEAV